MASHGRRLFLIVLLMGAACSAPLCAQEPPPWWSAMQEDATLWDVQFSDAEHGWAVGDRGVIWGTTDGGRQWLPQVSGVGARLNSVQFLSPSLGYVAGSSPLPHHPGSEGVLLVTQDGGQSWQWDPKLAIPGLSQLRFLSASHGWALGQPTTLFPSGLLQTTNGGRSWNPLHSDIGQAWTSGDFADPLAGAVAGPTGDLVCVRGRGVQPSSTASTGLRAVRRLKLANSTVGWAVGDGGLILKTNDLGRTWQEPVGDPGEAITVPLDFRALEVRGEHCWLAGSPGSRVLHSPDGGRSWEAGQTGQSLPLNALTFADDRHGWAVGALGTILTTADGGRTWHRQRSGGTRCAVLGVFSTPDMIPMEALARLGGNEGYLCQTLLLTRRDQEQARDFQQGLPSRAHAAVVAAGGCGAESLWGFPLRQPGLWQTTEQIQAGWDQAHDGQGIARLQAALVQQIRTWRPNVLVVPAASPRGLDPLGHLINQLTLRAAEDAADPTRFPEQLAGLSLEPWRVQKIYGSLPRGEMGSLNVTTAQLAPRLGMALGDFAAAARSLVHEEFQPAPTTLGFGLYVDTLPQSAGGRDFLGGITLHPGGEARRQLVDAVEGRELMRRVAQRHRNLSAILARPDLDQASGERFLGQIGELTTGLGQAAAGEVLFQLGQRYYQSGRWELAAEAFDYLAAQYPNHALTPAALTWLVQYWASGEAAHRARATTHGVIEAGQPLAQPTELPTPNTPADRVLPARQRQDLAGAAIPADERSQFAARAAERLAELRPLVHLEPAVQFPLVACQRSAGLTRGIERFFLELARNRPQDAWWACATGERWLAESGRGQPAKAVCRVSPASSRPRLDGRLDEDVWLHAEKLPLSSALRDDSQWPGVALVAYDQQFLYLAADCRMAAGLDYDETGEHRQRDTDPSAFDRVEWYLDLDRDWQTAYRLTIDQRGFGGDACWHDVTWNPTWYIAAGREDDRWVIEAAIPWSELCPTPPLAGAAWSLGVQRIVPLVGFQSWSTPAAIEAIPEGFGYLVFE